MEEEGNESVLDTKGKCFICCNPGGKRGTKKKGSGEGLTSIVHLYEYLNVEGRGDNERDELKAKLCDECEKLNERFETLWNKLKKVKLGIAFCLREVLDKLMIAGAKDLKFEGECLRVREEVVQKCFETLEPFSGQLANGQERNMSDGEVPKRVDVKVKSKSSSEKTGMNNHGHHHRSPKHSGSTSSFMDHSPSPPPKKSKQAANSSGNKEKEQSWKCDDCPSTFKQRYLLMRHRKSTHEEEPKEPKKIKEVINCKICKQAFSKRSQLAAHQETCGTSKAKSAKASAFTSHKCHACGKVFPTKQKLTVHLLTSHPSKDKFPCTMCKLKYATFSALSYHHIMRHPSDTPPNPEDYEGGGGPEVNEARPRSASPIEQQKPIISIPVPVVASSSTAAMPKLEEFTCKLCQKVYKSRAGLKKHVKEVHQDNTPLAQCDLCDRTFKRKEHLEVHRAFCSGPESTGKPPKPKKPKLDNIPPPPPVPEETSHLCDYCGKSFKTQQKMMDHRTKMHSNNEALNLAHVCSDCGKGFSSLNKLHKHVDLIHLGLGRKFKCVGPCTKEYKSKSQWKAHVEQCPIYKEVKNDKVNPSDRE